MFKKATLTEFISKRHIQRAEVDELTRTFAGVDVRGRDGVLARIVFEDSFVYPIPVPQR